MCQPEPQAGSCFHSVDTTIPPRIDLHQRTCEPIILESDKSLSARLMYCALLSDAVVQRVRRQEHITDVPTTSEDLIQQLAGKTLMQTRVFRHIPPRP